MDDICAVCGEKFTTRITCPGCEFSSCKKCYERHFLTSFDIKCMNCPVRFTKKFLHDNFTKTFLNGEYKRAKADAIFKIECAKFPENVGIVSKIMEKKLLKEELSALVKGSQDYKEMLTRISEVNRDIVRLRHGNMNRIPATPNPEYIEYIRNKGGGCGEMPSVIELRSYLDRVQYDIDGMYHLWRFLLYTRDINYDINFDTFELRTKYMTGEITERQFKKCVMFKITNSERNIAFNGVTQFFRLGVDDICRELVSTVYNMCMENLLHILKFIVKLYEFVDDVNYMVLDICEQFDCDVKFVDVKVLNGQIINIINRLKPKVVKKAHKGLHFDREVYEKYRTYYYERVSPMRRGIA
jgi:hypothetical protein